MTGLEKIIEDIRSESQAAVTKTMEEAEAKTAAIMGDAQKEAEQACEKVRKESSVKVADCAERAKSAADLARRKRVLEAKQDVISDVIEKAKAEMLSLPDDKYFETILKMAEMSAHDNESGEILFNKKDISRLPGGFENKLNAALKNGAKLSLSKRTAEIPGGFLLVYEGIEENCSFDAVFAARREELQDKVRGILFA